MNTEKERIDCTFRMRGVKVEVSYSFTCKCGKEITDWDFIDADPCDVNEDNALELWDNDHAGDTHALCPHCGRKYLLDKESFYEHDINVAKMVLVSE